MSVFLFTEWVQLIIQHWWDSWIFLSVLHWIQWHLRAKGRRGKKETFAIKKWHCFDQFFVRSHAPRGKTPYARRSKIYPAHYIIISFSLCWLYLAERLTCLTRPGPQTPPSHMYSFLKPRFFLFLPWSRQTWRCWHQAALPRTQTQELFIMPIGSFLPTSVLAA